MALAPGRRFGGYEIVESVGAGGMGEVYRATDTRLKRDVALKVLPQAFVEDADRLARFQREAEILASLNHPNIATIHGLEQADGQTVIVMELVEGTTLADRIEHGPIPPAESMTIALQVIAALEAAHDKQIVHRDLKPANVKVKDDGTVKVLDFGISKPIDPSAISGSAVATTPAVTQTGVILGTAAYMSPEQARGRFVDTRTDIWAFGCLMFEMLTGQPVFGGEDVMMTLARVLDRDADLSSMPKTLSPAVRHTIELCLEKDPRKRIADIRDVRLALEGTFESALPSVDRTGRVEPRRRAILPAAALLLGLVVGAAITAIAPRGDSSNTSSAPIRFSLTLPAEQSLTLGTGRLVALSPDGQTLVYRAEEGGVFKLFMRRLDDFETTLIPSSEGVDGELLFFSPDSRSIGFRLGTDLMRAQLSGGRPVPVTQISPVTREADWGADGGFVVARRTIEGLLRLSADGGELDSIAVSEALQAEGFNQFWYPQLIDDDNAVLVTAASGMQADAGSLVVIDLTTREARPILPSASSGYVLPTGHLLFVRGADLWAARFDLQTREVVGDPIFVLPGIRVEGGGAVQVAVADNGTIAYIVGTLAQQRTYQLVWVDREGREVEVGPPGTYDRLEVSPDETRVAVTAFTDGNWDIRVLDLVRGGQSRLTTDPGVDSGPIWSPGGTEIFFSTSRGGGSAIYRRSANGTSPAEPVLTGQSDPRLWPMTVLPDQDAILIDDQPGAFRRAALLTLGDEPSRAPLFEESAHVRRPALSPDGRWLAYESLETGQAEVWVRPFPDANGGRWPVSTNGGQSPEWTRGGQSLVFQEAGLLVQVDIETEPEVRAVNRVVVVNGGYDIDPGMWDVSDDGERFLVRKELTPSATDAGERPREEINVIVNIIEELDRLLPNN